MNTTALSKGPTPLWHKFVSYQEANSLQSAWAVALCLALNPNRGQLLQSVLVFHWQGAASSQYDI